MADPEDKAEKLIEVRCEKCNKLMFKAEAASAGKVEIVCSRCKEKNSVELQELLIDTSVSF